MIIIITVIINNKLKRESKQKFGDIISKRYGERTRVSVNKKIVYVYIGIKLSGLSG